MAKTVEQWREGTPKSFTFTAKLPSRITHKKMLLDAEDDLKAFLRVMDLLGDKLGPLLVQCPYYNKSKFRTLGFFLERFEPFLKQLPKDYSGSSMSGTRIGFRKSSIQCCEGTASRSPW